MALFGGSVLILLAFIYSATAGYARQQTDETIRSEIQGLSEQYRQRGLDGLAFTIAQRAARNPRGHMIYLLTDAGGRRIAGNIDRVPTDAAPDGWVDFLLQDPDLADSPYWARARHIVLPAGFQLFVGRDVQEQQHLRGLIVQALAWGLGITLALALAGGILMSRATLRRVEAVNRTSRKIMAGDLSRRIPESGSGDEFDQLAVNLNSMLDRVERLMGGIRHVSDNIAHDLKSPLTRMRNRLEFARMEEKDHQTKAVLDEALADIEALLATFNALLRIAEVEAGNRRAEFAPVDLVALARDTADLYEPVAHDKGQTIAVTAPVDAEVLGDRNLLAQALANLIDNAIKYGPSGGRIAVSVAAGPDAIILSVADTGPGIPPEYRDKVLERFFRLEASRSTPGSGLGLSLVAAVAKLHGATLRLGDSNPGLTVDLIILASPCGKPDD